MRTCEDLERYLDRRLAPRESIEFEAHLPRCPRCAAAVDRWLAAARDLTDAPRSRPVTPPSPAEAARLVAIASSRRGRSRWAWVAAAAAMLAIGGAVAVALLETDPEAGRATAVPEIAATLLLDSVTRDVDPAELLRRGLVVPKSGRATLHIGDDEIDAAAGSRLALVQITAAVTRVRLEAGSVDCTVARRAPGREFVVEAGEFSVRVRGTRFTVAIPEGGGIGVRVESGTVEVSSGGVALRRLGAGERFAIPDAAPPAVAVPAVGEAAPETDVAGVTERRGEASTTSKGAPAPTIETLRSWIVGGQYADAETELRARLAKAPLDVEARSLLADCLRKQLRWREAATVYRDVAAAGDPVLSPRAQSLIRDIQADHPDVAEGNPGLAQ